MKKQTEYIRAKIEEAKAHSPSVSETVWHALDDLLWDSLCSRDLLPFSLEQYGDGIRVCWNVDNGVSVTWAIFSSSTPDWEWHSTTTKFDVTTDGDNTYTITYHHNGPCSFWYKNTPHYFFPDEVEELVSVPDKFDKEYGPMIRREEWRLLWETNRYDGMLSGYVSFKGKTHYADMVDETDFQRKRMYAVYELPWIERVGAHLRHKWWTFVHSNRVLWTIRWKLARMRKPTSVDKYHLFKKKFRDTHRVVGYFEG